MAAGSAATRFKRILTLHGKGGDAASFARRPAPLSERLGSAAELVFIDAPFPSDGNGRQWWKLPPGVRSYEADSYEGVEESIAAIDAAFGEHGELDGMLGFSQGAMLMAFYIAQNPQKRLNGESANLPRKAAIVGAAWPKPFGGDLEALSDVEGIALLGCDTLHVIGDADDMEPPEQATAVWKCFGAAGTVMRHPGGHVVPVDDESLDMLSGFLALDGCESEEECEVAGV